MTPEKVQIALAIAAAYSARATYALARQVAFAADIEADLMEKADWTERQKSIDAIEESIESLDVLINRLDEIELDEPEAED